ncbi:hypothetical protein [Roseomonas indoligenes]|uniref:Uncharacterized protein n=1 Tax=Roseomonas indoligenes TaxID=2820811 RepID=A0A940S5F5_9PROT|nr:hypothetical protein [Pararoseomonas indoligenes]MBP0492895.1 hypothetical protein [Pararoseomonas indoligenes]
MSDPTYQPPYKPVSSTPYDQPDPARVGVTRMNPFEHFCAVCGAGAGFGFGGDFMRGEPGLWACMKHRAEVEQRWRRG